MQTESPLLDAETIADNMQALNPDWQLVDEAGAIERRFEFKGYARAVYTANLCAALCDRLNHHAEITFGWGYCQLRISTHDAGGVTMRDFELAMKVDSAMAL